MIHGSIMRAARISYMLCIGWHCIRYTDTPSYPYSLRFSLSLKLAVHIRIYQPSASGSRCFAALHIGTYIVIVVKVHNKMKIAYQVFISINSISTAIGYSD